MNLRKISIPGRRQPSQMSAQLNFRTPSDYHARISNPLYNDLPGAFIYQPHVYKLAGHLASLSQLPFIIDIGCGSGQKLIPLAKNHTIIGIDSDFGTRTAQANLPNAELISFNLEAGLPDLPPEKIARSVIICSDVIEHLQNPQNLVTKLADFSEICPFLLISTPDRDRARGWQDFGPPANEAHVREWAPSELIRFLADCGFKEIPFCGHTINTDFHRVKSTLLALSGRFAHPCRENITKRKVAAIIHGFNECDILPEVVRHLHQQNVEVHYFDNWSTDGTWENAQHLKSAGLLTHVERFPDKPTEQYEWHEQLKKTEQYARTIDADWVMHHDADEIRVSPWNNLNLCESISFIDGLGFNAIDFTVIDFRPCKNIEFASHFQDNLTHFEFGRRPGHFKQLKCWKNTQTVDLASSGGHEVGFVEKKVFPLKFLLKHYPLRSAAQAERKIFKDRLPRFGKERNERGWHTHYDSLSNAAKQGGVEINWVYHQLLPFNRNTFNTDFLVERLSGIGLLDD